MGTVFPRRKCPPPVLRTTPSRELQQAVHEPATGTGVVYSYHRGQMPPRFWDLAHECGHAAYAKLVGNIDMLNLGSLRM